MSEPIWATGGRAGVKAGVEQVIPSTRWSWPPACGNAAVA